jgi:hypothetical protein
VADRAAALNRVSSQLIQMLGKEPRLPAGARSPSNMVDRCVHRQPSRPPVVCQAV